MNRCHPSEVLPTLTHRLLFSSALAALALVAANPNPPARAADVSADHAAQMAASLELFKTRSAAC